MKDKQVIIRVPEPCNEDWNKMSPNEKGRFCASCATSVVDFSKMSDEELKVFLINNKGQKTCGHFKQSQLNKPVNITVDLRQMPSNMNATYKFVMALFIVFGSLLFSCTDLNGNRVKEIKIEDNEEKSYVMGMMVMPPPPEVVVDTLIEEELPPPPVMVGYEEGEMMGAVAFDYDYEDDSLTGDVIVVEEPNFSPIDSCSFDGVEKVGFSPPLIIPDTINEDQIVLGEMYLIRCEETETIFDGSKFNDKSTIQLVTDWKVFPNPSNGNTTIQYYLQQKANVRLDVFDVNGKHITTLVNMNDQHTGIYHIPFDGTDLPNGIYTISLIINGVQSAEKLIVEK